MIVDALFPTYRFDKAETEDFLIIDQWSYVWAAFVGPLFVVTKRLYFLAFIDLLAMIAIVGGAIFALTVVVYLFSASMEGIILILVTVIGALSTNAIVAVRLVRHGYLERGWRLGF